MSTTATNNGNRRKKSKLVVEVLSAHNLIPKDGEGSSSPFVEVTFENQRQRTQVKYKDLNPIWNEKLIFSVNEVADLPYRTIELSLFNEKRSGTRNFLGKVRVSGSHVVKESDAGDVAAVVQVHPLDKRSLFSNVRGEIKLRMYLLSRVEMKKGLASNSKKSKKRDQQQEQELQVQQQHHQDQHQELLMQQQFQQLQYYQHQQQQQQQQQMLGMMQQDNSNKKRQENHHFHPYRNNNRANIQSQNRKTGDPNPNPNQQLTPSNPGGQHQTTKPVNILTTIPNPTTPTITSSGQLIPSGGSIVTISGGSGGGGGYTSSSGSHDFTLKETRPELGGGPHHKNLTYDLVEQMQYLYVRVVKAKNLQTNKLISVEVKLGNYKGVTNRVKSTTTTNTNTPTWEWDQVFAFSNDCISSSVTEIFIKDDDNNQYLGRICFNLNEVPRRVPPDSQLAPEWYRMEEKDHNNNNYGKGTGGEVMISVWFGTQADESFTFAWHSKTVNVHSDGLSSIKSQVYISPKLWYLRIKVIEAQDVTLFDNTNNKTGISTMRYQQQQEVVVKVQVGNQLLRTRILTMSSNMKWNEELMFVVAEPLDDYILISMEDHRIGQEVIGRVILPLTIIERRWDDDKPVSSRWLNLSDSSSSSSSSKHFGSRIHIQASLNGGYHVLDEAVMYTSDVRPTAKQLWKNPVGMLEMGILGATGLMPMKHKEEGKGGGTVSTTTTTDAYCVAKYGQKWVRTRTVVDSLSPKWNEQYTWEVYDPCTVITVGVFDNSRVDKISSTTTATTPPRDGWIGKVRIRLSTLDTDRVYTHSYPLLMLHTSGVKKMGELHLAIRFSCANMGNMMHIYATSLLPNMHYIHPLGVTQLESLRYQAVNVVSARLVRAEPPLGREVVEYMLDHESNLWSMRRSKANFFRLMTVMSGLVATVRLLDGLRSWRKPFFSTIFVIIFLFLVIAPELILPGSLFSMAVLGLLRYRHRPRNPPHVDTTWISHVYPGELDEEFDPFPTNRNVDVIRMRYDRLRSVAGRIQTFVGDMATQGERFQALLSWRDPRATFLFVIFCLFAAIGLYIVPIRVIVAVSGLYAMRPPKFRPRLPSQALSFFRRLPSRADTML